MQQYTFNNHALDDGYNDNLIWNTLQGNFFYSEIKGYCTLGDHLDPILLLFLPFYFFGLGPRFLFITQTILIALGALPIYWLAKERLKDSPFTLLFPLAYLLYIPTVNITFQGFYQIALAITPLLLAFYYLLNDKYRPFLLWLLVALFCQEDVALVAAFLGGYILLKKKPKLLGSSLLLGGLALFVIDLQIIIPYFKGTNYTYFERYAYLGTSTAAALKTLFTRPFFVFKHILITDKILYLVGLFLPVAFLSFLAPSALIPAIPALAQNLLSTYSDMYQLGTRYPSATIPFVFMSAILGLEKLLQTIQEPSAKERILKLIRRTMIFCLVLSMLYFFLGFFFRYTTVTPAVRDGQALLPLVPKDAAISALGNLYPHLAHRKNIWIFPKNYEQSDYLILCKLDPTWPLEGDYTPVIKQLLKEKNYAKLLEFTFIGEVPRAPIAQKEYQIWFDKVMADPNFKLVAEKKYYLLLKSRRAKNK